RPDTTQPSFPKPSVAGSASRGTGIILGSMEPRARPKIGNPGHAWPGPGAVLDPDDPPGVPRPQKRHSMKSSSNLPELIDKHEKALLAEWLEQQKAAGAGDLAGEEELRAIAGRFLTAFQEGMRSGQSTDIAGAAWAPARAVLEDVSRQRALRGATPSQTATF